MPKLDIEKLDRYLRNAKIDPAGLRWLDPRDEKNFEVLGFYWFKTEKRWHRFPLKAENCGIRPAVLTLAGCTAGGQLRFRTDSSRIVLSVRTVSKAYTPGRSGFDLYTGELGHLPSSM